jgi:hypothetical protein
MCGLSRMFALRARTCLHRPKEGGLLCKHVELSSDQGQPVILPCIVEPDEMVQRINSPELGGEDG